MAKPKVINPCRMKGRYVGHRGGGRIYKPNLRPSVKSKTCECACAFLNFCSQDKNHLSPDSIFSLNKKSESTSTDFLRTSVLDELPEGSLKAVACEKTFLHADSEGTTAFRNLKRRQKMQTKFIGCYSVYEDLLNEKSLNYDIREGTGTHFDVKDALAVQDYADEILEANWAQVLTKFSGEDEITGLQNLGILTAVMQDMETQHIHNNADPLLEQVMNPENESSEELQQEYKERLDRALKKMTKLQRQAVRAVFLRNYENKTRIQIAKELGISVDSLKERLNYAFQKVKSEFIGAFKNKAKASPEVILRSAPLERIPQIPQPIKATRNGFINWIIPTPDNLKPFGELKQKAGIDVELIKRKIRA